MKKSREPKQALRPIRTTRAIRTDELDRVRGGGGATTPVAALARTGTDPASATK